MNLSKEEVVKFLQGMEKDLRCFSQTPVEKLAEYAKIVDADGATVWAKYQAEALRMAIQVMSNQD